MRKPILAILVLSSATWAQVVAYNGQCSKGGQLVVTQGQKSKGTTPITGGPIETGTGVLASYPSCTVSVFLTGTALPANLFSDTHGTVLANPFTANTDGSFLFFAAPGTYDLTLSSSRMPSSASLTAVVLAGFGGSATWGSIVGTLSDQTDLQNALNLLAPLNSPSFTGTIHLPLVGPQCLQVDASGNVQGSGLPCGSGGGGNVSSVFTRTGAVVATSGDYTVAQVTGAAPLASPTFTGTVAGITASMVGLGNVTNDTQTQAAVMPNTPPAAGAVPIGNAGGTAYVPHTLSGDASMTSAGVVTNSKINGITVSGTPSTGQVPTATGSTAATWQAPAVASVFGRTGAVVAATNDYTEAQISFSNITTNNVSTSQHGYAPILPNDSSKFLNGIGTYTTPAGAGNVSNTGTPTNGQVGVWTAATTLSGVSPTGTGTPVFNTSPTFATGVTFSFAATGCLQSTAGVITSTGSACGSTGGMVFPTGTGIPQVVSGTSWGTTLTETGTGTVAVLQNSPTFTGTVSGITATMVGLGSVTNDAQTKAAVVPNTAPGAGQLLVGNAGGTAYAPVSLSGDGTLTSAGVLTNTKLNGVAVPTSATVLGSNGSNQLVTATTQGNGSKVQLSTGTTTTNDCVKFDANGNTVDAGAVCGNLVTSVFGRTGAVVAVGGDYSVGQITGAAPLASPTFTGTVSGVTAAMVGLGSVTNDVQTKASIVPNTAPSAGQILIGNAGGTAYAKNSLSGDATLTATGVVTNTRLNGAAIPASATVLGTNASTQLVNASVQGNGTKVQLSTGTATVNRLVKRDANGNTIDSNVTETTGTMNGFQVGTNLFSSLSACVSGLEGTMAGVTDSTTNTWGATITGGGSTHVLAYCDGSTWTVMGK